MTTLTAPRTVALTASLTVSLAPDELIAAEAEARHEAMDVKDWVRQLIWERLQVKHVERSDDDDLPELPNDPNHPYAWGRPIQLNAEQTAALRQAAKHIEVADGAQMAATNAERAGARRRG